jgi:hypothetical protein
MYGFRATAQTSVVDGDEMGCHDITDPGVA